MNDNQTYQRIEDYLLQKLSLTERAAFEKELNTNEVLAAQFQTQELEHKMMEAIVEKDLLKDLEKWTAEDTLANEPQIEKKNNFSLQQIWKLAALLAVGLVILFFWNQNEKPVPPIVEKTPIIDSSKINSNQLPIDSAKTIKEDTTNKNGVKPINPTLPKIQKKPSNSTPAKQPKKPRIIALAKTFHESIDFGGEGFRTKIKLDSIKLARKRLSEKDFDLGIQILSDVIARDTSGTKAKFYLGLAYFENGNFEQAITLLQPISISDYGEADKAGWLVCLAYFQTKNLKKGQDLLTIIVSDPIHDFHKKATKFQKEIDLIQIKNK